MNLKDCVVGLRVSWHDNKADKWLCGKVEQTEGHKAKVKPENGEHQRELLIRNLRFAPPYYKAVLTVDRAAITSLLMDQRTLKITLDVSGSYEKGYTHPLNVTLIPSDGTDKEEVARGIYLSADGGDLLLGRPDPM